MFTEEESWRTDAIYPPHSEAAVTKSVALLAGEANGSIGQNGKSRHRPARVGSTVVNNDSKAV